MISVTQSAVKHIRKSIERRGKGLGIRIGLKKSGCSGYSYNLEYADYICEDDLDFIINKDLKLVINEKNYQYLDGLELDYGREGLNEGFKFNNPNVTAECGCGESFSVNE